jgi:outer membrane protein
MSALRRVAALLVVALAFIAASRCPAQTIQRLTLKEAEQIALKNHPQVQAAMDIATAMQAQVREQRSYSYPTVYGSFTGAYAENDSRIEAGLLNNPSVYDRLAAGLTVNQLVTDFGRTQELVKTANFRAKAAQEDVVTTKADVVLQADRAYFGVLQAQAVLQVAQQTVNNRQLVDDQIGALAKNLLRSTLDVRFADYDLAQAKLLLIQAQNNLQASFADLTTALGYSDQRSFVLAEEPMPPAPAPDSTGLIQQALTNRPEMISERLNVESAKSYTTAERDLYFPTIMAAGVAGLAPIHQSPLTDRYVAAGFNVNIPIFNGHLFGALHSEAEAREHSDQQNLRDLQDSIVRDVQTAWLNAKSAYDKLAVTEELLTAASEALKLAQSRYQLGLSSIVELSQAQLNLTQAQIEEASAKYDYQTQVAALNFALGNLP